MDELESNVRNWYPRNILRHTKWLHRVDALRNYDIRESGLLWEVASLCLEQCNQFLVWDHVVKHFTNVVPDVSFQLHLKSVFDVIIEILQLLYS